MWTLAFFGVICCSQVSSQPAVNRVFQRAADSTLKLPADIAISNRMLYRSGIDKARRVYFFRHHVTKSARFISTAGNMLMNFTLQTVRQGQRKSAESFILSKRIIECPFTKRTCNSADKFRTIDGTCNNLKNPLFGAANVPFTRFIPPSYDDRVNSPRTRDSKGRNLPSARLVSMTVLPHSDKTTSMDKLNLFGVFFGQFIAHDFERFAVQPAEGKTLIDCCASKALKIVRPHSPCFPIDVPRNDRFFSRFNITCINFIRSLPTPSLDCKLGPRQQLTQVTGFIDTSNVYGSSAAEEQTLRQEQSGLLKVTRCASEELFPPDLKKETECNLENTSRFDCFIAGDVRVNENPGLAVHHLIWLREHNRIARSLAKINFHWNDERLFQESRRIVIAEMQHIVFNEFLPAIIGHHTAKLLNLTSQSKGFFNGYNEKLDATPRNGFSTAAFRFGHSMLADEIPFFGGCLNFDFQCTPEVVKESFSRSIPHQFTTKNKASRVCLNNKLSVCLRQVFERSDSFYQTVTGVDAIIRGLLLTKAQRVDNKFSREITDHLFEFGMPGHGLDLAALNIQRGRDHGIPPYNKWRKFCGLPKVEQWGTGRHRLIDHTADVARLLQKAYRHPDDIDLFVGGISEKPFRDSLLGPTFSCILVNQFKIFKNGDRFWYENSSSNPKPFSSEQLNSIRKTKYSRVVADNTGLNRIFRDVFRPFHRNENPTMTVGELSRLQLQLWKDKK